MELRFAGAAFIIGGLGLIVSAVAYFDWRAGLALSSVLVVAAGIQVLRSTRG
jgi:hypothetical protein